MREDISMKKEEYIKKITELAISPTIKNKHIALSNLLYKYFLFCYRNKIYYYDDNLPINLIRNASYIIESIPDILEMDQVKMQNTIAHLKEVQVNNRFGLVDGISLEEADYLLEFNMQHARKSLENIAKEDVLTSSLQGMCGEMQSITLVPLQNLGLEVTINNVRAFPQVFKTFGHDFGTVKIPIKENNKVYIKSYLIDGSYRQFFTTYGCTEGNFYKTNSNLTNTDAPDAGYFVCLTKKGRHFAKILLKRGFIEWTLENAKIYRSGFSCASSITKKNVRDYHKIRKIPKEIYFTSVFYSSEKLDYDKEELENDGFQLDLENLSGTHTI